MPLKLHELDVYRLAREIARYAWGIYDLFDWQTKKLMGDQWIEAIDSMSANIAEGFGRFHFLDKNKFNYNARGSLFEALDWTDKLYERNKIQNEEHTWLIDHLVDLRIKLNRYIRTTKDWKNNEKHAEGK